MDIQLAINPRTTLAAYAATKPAAWARSAAAVPAASRPAPAAVASSLPAAKPIADSLMTVLLAAQNDAHAVERKAHGHGHGHDDDHGEDRGHGHKPPVASAPPVTPPPVDPPPAADPPPVASPPPVTTPPPVTPAPAPATDLIAAHIATPRIVEVVRELLAERTTPSRRRLSAREQTYLAAARTQHLSTVKLAGMRAALRWQTAASLLATGQAQPLALRRQPYRTSLFA